MDRGIRTDERVNVWDADFWHLNEGDGSPLALLHSGHPFEDEVDVFLNSYQCQVGTGLSSGSIFATRVAQQTRMRMKKNMISSGGLGFCCVFEEFRCDLGDIYYLKMLDYRPTVFLDAIMIHMYCVYIYIYTLYTVIFNRVFALRGISFQNLQDFLWQCVLKLMMETWHWRQPPTRA